MRSTFATAFVLIFVSGAFAGSRCANELLKDGATLHVSAHPKNNQALQVVLRNKDGERINCADRPARQYRQIKHIARIMKTNGSWSLEDLLSFTTLTWPELALGASAEIFRKSKMAPSDFSDDQVERMAQILLEDRPDRIVAWYVIKSLGQLATPIATQSLSKILKLGHNLDYRYFAARMLGKVRSKASLTALERCAESTEEKMVKRCKRILGRLKIRAELELQDK